MDIKAADLDEMIKALKRQIVYTHVLEKKDDVDQDLMKFVEDSMFAAYRLGQGHKIMVKKEV